MKSRKTTRRAGAALLCAGVLTLASYNFNPGGPYWHLGLFEKTHYKVDLPDASFPSGSPLEAAAIAALDDWESIGDTDLVTDYTKRNNSPFDNSDGRNAWGFGPQPFTTTGVTLATTTWRYSGSKMIEADTIFADAVTFAAAALAAGTPGTSRYWVNNQLNPASTPPALAQSFRAVARHEAGHALGLAHEDDELSVMNTLYSHGSGAAHTAADGMLPHADDKAGCRALYPAGATLTTYNLMATCWQEPGTMPAGSEVSAPRIARLTGTYVRGDPVLVRCYLENQGQVVSDIHVGVFLSADQTIGAGDIQVGDVTFPGWWPSYTSGAYDLPATLDAPTGTYYVLVRIDSDRTVTEQWESDNDIEVGQVDVVEWDLAVTAFNIGDLTPVRGVSVLADITVRNLGTGVSPDTKVRLHLARNTSWGPVPDYDFVLGDLTVSPGLSAGEYRGVSGWVQIPPTLCANRTWQMYATIDPDDEIPETDETNNALFLDFYPQWTPGAAYQIGQLTPAISSSSSDARYQFDACSRAPAGANTWYFFLWTGSGTTPGTPLGGLGTLPLNVDGLTHAGIVLYGSLFAQMSGPQLATVERATIVGDPLLAPLVGMTTHFAAVYVDTAAMSFVGIAREALEMTIR